MSHPVLRMPLVLNLFKSDTVSADEFTEAHLASRIVSPHVVGVINAGHEKGVPFIVQRYVDGVDLDELIKEAKAAALAIPANIIAHVLIGVARGLHSLHQAGVIHRDIKPANLFLRGDGTAAVGDLGIAVDTSDETTKGNPSGTPSFMAPEAWPPKYGEVGRHTDIYALGVTAHLLMTGRLPFEGRTMDQMRAAHLGEIYRPPAAETPVDAYLFSAIERTLRKNPDERFTTAEELARVLGRITEELPQFINTNPGSARVGPLAVALAEGDITKESADVIVSASNSSLEMDLGVSGALKLAAGEAVEQEAVKQGPVAMGDVVWTGAGRLPADHMAHAVAALDGAVCLQRCVLRVLLRAEVRGAGSVVFPALGTDVGDVPMELAAKLMLEAIQTFSALKPKHVREVRIVLFKAKNLARWSSILKSM